MASPWIRTTDELARKAASFADCRSIALDSESDSLHHHFEKVCLVQFATDRGEAGLIDPLSAKDLSPLAPLVADPGIVKVFHGADYDVTTLKRDFTFRFVNLFDTMLAARFLAMPEIGLQAVVKAELGIELTKDSQKDDWSRRPLSPRQEAYALDDVRHLLDLHRRLAGRLRDKGRLSWVEEECAAVAALEPARRGKDADAWQKVKGLRALTPRRLAVVREVYTWRESVAEATDTPAFRILSSETLVALAEKQPLTLAELRQVRGVLPRLSAHAAAILEAVARASALPESDLPRTPSAPPRPVVSPETRRRVDLLRAWRTAEAARIGLDVSVVLPQRLLDRVAEAAPRDRAALDAIEGLRRWRVETFGDAVLGVLRKT